MGKSSARQLAASFFSAGRGPVVWGVEIVLAILLAWLFGLLIATLVEPLPDIQPVAPPGAVNGAVNDVDQGAKPALLNPFRGEPGAAAASIDVTPAENFAETTLDLVLYGTWVANGGGTAFIGAGDDDQKRYSIGEKISAGVTLKQVYRDRVTISRGGVSETLKIKNWQSVGEERDSARPAPPSANSGSPIPDSQSGQNQSFTDIVRVSSETSIDEGMRFALKPARDIEAFEALGLEEGDILISIDEFDVASAPASIGPAIRQLQGKSETTFVVDRDGVRTPVPILLPENDPETDDEIATYEN